MKQSSTISANSTNTQSVNLNLYEGSSTNTNLSSSEKSQKNCNNILIQDVSRSSFHLVLLPLSQSSEYPTENTIVEKPFDNPSPNQNQLNTNKDNNLIQRGSPNESDLSYTYLYQSIDSESMKKIQDQNILNKELVTPEYLSRNVENKISKQPYPSNSDYTYIYESLSDAHGFKNNGQSEYTYVYSYGGYDNDQLTSEYTYTYDEPSAGQINFYENQQNNTLNKALKTRNILLDKKPNTIINQNPQSPNFSISNQPPIFIQRTPKKINSNYLNLPKRQITQKQTESPKKLSPHKRSVLRKINLLEEELKYLDSSTNMDNDFSSTEFTESEAKEDPKIKLLQQKLAKITGKNIQNPNDHYSLENSQYTYTYAYDESYEDIKKFHAKQKLNHKSKSSSKVNSRSKSIATTSKPKKSNQSPHKKNLNSPSPKERNMNFSTQQDAITKLPSPKTPILVLQTFNDKAISIENMNNSNQGQDQKNKVDLQISSSVRSEKVLKPDQMQIEKLQQQFSNSTTLESTNDDNDNTEIKDRSIKLNNEKTIKKIYRRIKVDKPKSKNPKKDEKDFYVNPSIYQSSPKKVKSLLSISDEDNLNDSEFAALNPVDARKFTSSHKIDTKDKTKSVESNDTVKIKIVEDTNVPNVDRFCVFYIEGDEDSIKRTKTISKDQNQFNEQFDFALNELFPSKLVIFLKKQDLVKEDKIMGTAKIDLKKVPLNSTLSKWISLKSDSGIKIESKIHLVLKRETKIPKKDQVFEDLMKRDNNIDNNEKVKSHHRSRRRHHKKPNERNNEKHAKNKTRNDDFNEIPEQIENDSENQISDHDSSEIRTRNVSNFEVQKIEAEAQVDLLSESSDSADNEFEEEEGQEEEDKEDEEEKDLKISKHRKERKLPILNESSSTYSHEEKSHKESLEESSHGSNKENEHKASDLEENSNDYNEEEEEESKLSELEEYSSHPSNKDKKSQNSNLDEYLHSSNKDRRSQNSNLDKSSHSSFKERKSQNSNFDESSHTSTKDRKSQNSNLENSLHSFDIEEERSHKSRNSHKSQSSNLNRESSKSQFDDESSKTKQVKISQISNDKQKQSTNSNFIEESATSILGSFMSSTDSLRSDKYRAVELENNFHSTDTFISSISESYKHSEDDQNDEESNQSDNSNNNYRNKSIKISNDDDDNNNFSSSSGNSKNKKKFSSSNGINQNSNLSNNFSSSNGNNNKNNNDNNLSSSSGNNDNNIININDDNKLSSSTSSNNIPIKKVPTILKVESETSESPHFSQSDNLSGKEKQRQLDIDSNCSSLSSVRSESISADDTVLNRNDSFYSYASDQNNKQINQDNKNIISRGSSNFSQNSANTNISRDPSSNLFSAVTDKNIKKSIEKVQQPSNYKFESSETLSESNLRKRKSTKKKKNQNSKREKINQNIDESPSLSDKSDTHNLIPNIKIRNARTNIESEYDLSSTSLSPPPLPQQSNSSHYFSSCESTQNSQTESENEKQNQSGSESGDSKRRRKSKSVTRSSRKEKVVKSSTLNREIKINKSENDSENQTKSENDSESERFDSNSNSNSITASLVSDNNSSFNELFSNQPLFEEKIHSFNSSFSESKEEKSSTNSNSINNNNSVSTSSKNIKVSSSSNPSKKVVKETLFLSSLTSEEGSKNSNQKLSSLHESENLSSIPENNEDLKEEILEKNSRTPRNMPDTQDLSNTEEPFNMNNSSFVFNSKLSDDSLGSSSSKKIKPPRRRFSKI